MEAPLLEVGSNGADRCRFPFLGICERHGQVEYYALGGLRREIRREYPRIDQVRDSAISGQDRHEMRKCMFGLHFPYVHTHYSRNAYGFGVRLAHQERTGIMRTSRPLSPNGSHASQLDRR